MNRSAAFALAMSLTVSIAPAQLNTGSISGTITDPNGAAVPGAKVLASNEATGLKTETVTSDAGLYVLPSLPVGIYTVTIEKPGFKRLNRTNLEVRVAQRLTLDLRMELGDVQQTIDVTAEAPLLESSTSERGQNFSPKFMSTLPLFTGGIRNPESFVTYMPGVNSYREVSINGSGGRGKEVLIDGASLTIPESGGVVFNFPSAEMFGEFKLLTSTYAAEYGRFGGGVEVFLTKSGNNDLHGAAFWNLRRDIFNAAAWAVNANPRNAPGFRPKERFNEAGGALGGPVFIPKVYDGRNRTFWYFTYTRDLRPATIAATTSSVATPLMKQGIFTEIPRMIYDPATTSGNSRTPFPGNIIPRSRFSRVSNNILPSIPDSNLPGTVNNYSFVNESALTDDVWSLKIDHAFSPNNRVSYFHSLQDQNINNTTALPGPLGQGLGGNTQKPRNYRINHDWVIKPTVLMHSTFGFSQTRQGWDNPLQNGFASKITLPAQTDATPRVLFTPADGLTAWGVQDGKVRGGGQTNGQNNTTYQFSSAVTWLRGKHEFKFGGDIRRLQTSAFDAAGSSGRYNFERAQTALPTNTGGTGYSFASFLLGTPNAADTTALPVPDVQIRYGYHAGFFQDNWKVASRLTVNLGVRYEVPIGWHMSNYNYSKMDPTIPNPGADNRAGALVFAGPGTGRTGQKRMYPTDYSDFGPRAGFAYRVTEKTVLRGGFGIFFQTLGNGGCGCTLGFAGAPAQVLSDGVNPALNWDGGIPVPPGLARPPFIDPAFGNFQNVDLQGPNFGKAARIYNWSFNIQHEVKSFLLDVAYVGNRGTQLASTLEGNQVDPKYLSLGALLRQPISSPAVIAAGFKKPYPSFPDNQTLAQALRPFPQYLSVSDRNSGDGRTWYDSMQAKVERRYGLWQMMAAYTWSKSQVKLHFRQIFSQTQVTAQNAYDLSDTKSLSPFDIPHAFNFLNSFDLPFGKGRKFINTNNAFVDLLVGGWSVATIQRYVNSGPIDIVAPNTIGNGVLFSRYKKANTTGAPVRTALSRGDLDPNNPGALFFNPGAFALPGEFQMGSASQFWTDFRQPKIFQENLSIAKRFKFRPKDRPLDFIYRADFFNLFNRTNFAVNGAIGNPNFGRATGPQQGARVITMGLRLEF